MPEPVQDRTLIQQERRGKGKPASNNRHPFAPRTIGRLERYLECIASYMGDKRIGRVLHVSAGDPSRCREANRVGKGTNDRSKNGIR
jgi:hypothetical protein